MPDPQPEQAPHTVTPLKQDGFGRVERVERAGARVARRVACGGRVPLSRVVAHVLLRRERRALAALESFPCVPATVEGGGWSALPGADGRVPAAGDVHVRSWMEGEPLHRAMELPADFFDELEALVVALHARGVCHNDLHKEPNIVVGSDGRPALIDFQLASVHRFTAGPLARLFASRCRDDLRHVRKHARRYALRGDSSRAAKERAGALPRRSVVARLWRRGFKPLYEFVTRRVLRLRSSEERRPNAGPWPRTTAPIGPSGRSS